LKNPEKVLKRGSSGAMAERRGVALQRLERRPSVDEQTIRGEQRVNRDIRLERLPMFNGRDGA
jgi:hypothetical protein